MWRNVDEPYVGFREKEMNHIVDLEKCRWINKVRNRENKMISLILKKCFEIHLVFWFDPNNY
jgi:hypothetical protein